MSEYISNVLVILACPQDETDKRQMEIIKLCRMFNQHCASRGLVVDFLDLYSEKEFLAMDYNLANNSKILEYQIRINKADAVVFFHPVWLDTVPAVLKGFLESSLTSGFAYKIENRISVPLLGGKQSLVFAFDSKSAWESGFVFGNQLWNFWSRSIFNFSGLDGKLFLTNNFRSADASQVEIWKKQITKIANKLKVRPSGIDL